MVPSIRHMLLCDTAHRRKNNPSKLDLLGLLSIVRPKEFPFRLTFSVFLEMTGGRGSGHAKIQISHADDDQIIFVGNELPLRFSPDPTAIQAVLFQVHSCEFAKPGLYTVEFMYNGARLSHEPLLVKEPT